MLSFSLQTHRESKDLLLPAWATSSFTTVAGQGWLAGLAEPALDAGPTLACRRVRRQAGIGSSDRDGLFEQKFGAHKHDRSSSGPRKAVSCCACLTRALPAPANAAREGEAELRWTTLTGKEERCWLRSLWGLRNLGESHMKTTLLMSTLATCALLNLAPSGGLANVLSPGDTGVAPDTFTAPPAFTILTLLPMARSQATCSIPRTLMNL